ncbi:amino acid ABC transporter substrate-binding protein (PAAT family) [Georgenia soli]|uniref:Amino acid ABC transporter substrate-binding protein (PAAT family) n=1 Tax=Georgenia soli TaxID=638953 RepID=A0A2A9ES11_9MICO|nr:ABC transporter substrate-binding protein [Georgenia soli]PFG41346.1 amino acid ABC transporter substrate-binding protein (PAAT family) [Georgenia soli]
MRRLPVLALAATAGALVLSSCTNASEASAPASGDSAAAAEPSYDVTGIDKVDEIAGMLPEDFDGTLTVGDNLQYAPAEFLGGPDGQTPTGYDVDLAKALGRVLGVEVDVQHAEFASIIPAIGTQYDAGIASFSINPERIEQVDMIAYISAGSTFSVQQGNPKDLDPADLCGTTMGVQTGTIQDEDADRLAAECTDAGAEPIEVLRYTSQADVTTNLVGGKIDVMYADSPVGQYAALQTGGQVEQLGDVTDAAPQGIAVSKDDPELTAALQAAMQHLMDEGVWEDILGTWGVTGALTTAELNPAV